MNAVSIMPVGAETDAELIQRFELTRSPAAMAELVRRHVDMVYATALRGVRGDKHLAEDVMQAVFTILVRKAGRIRGHVCIAGWLFRTTRYSCSTAMRAQRRRRRREEQGAKNEIESEHPQPHGEIDQLLNGAIASLRKKEQQAVILRYLQGHSLIEVGRMLGVTEDAARVRVRRAVEKLRGYFMRRGISADSVLAVEGAIVAKAVEADVMAKAIAAASSAAVGAAAGEAGILAGKVMKEMVMAKLMIAGAVSLAVIAAATAGSSVARRAVAAGPSTAPTMATAMVPTTGPTAVAQRPRLKVDLSSPMANWKSQKRAMAEGEWEAFAACYYGRSADEEQAINAFARPACAPAAYKRTLGEKFGTDPRSVGNLGLNMDVPRGAREHIDADQATISGVGGPRPVTLVKVNGEWRMNYIEIPRGNYRDLPPLSPAMFAEVADAGAKVYESVTAEIEDGMIDSRADAEAEIERRNQERVRKLQERLRAIQEGTDK